MIAGSYECSKAPTTPFSVVMVSYSCSTFWHDPRLAIQLLLIFFLGDKTFHARKNPFRNEGDNSGIYFGRMLRASTL